MILNTLIEYGLESINSYQEIMCRKCTKCTSQYGYKTYSVHLIYVKEL